MGDWSQLAQFVHAPRMQNFFEDFATSVAIDGDTIVATDSPYPGNPVGFIFTKSSGGWRSELPNAALSLPAGVRGNFVNPAAISSNTVVIGVASGNGSPGQVYVYVKPAGGWTNMTPTAILSPVSTDSSFGATVAISGDTIVVGEDDLNSNAGAACVFVKPAGGWTNMTPTAVLTASDGQPDDYFGQSVSISGNTIAVGAPQNVQSEGKAYVFVEPQSGWTNMTQTAELTASDAQTGFFVGTSISVNGDTIAVGTPDPNSFAGEAYVFVKPPSGWVNVTQTARLVAADREHFDFFGSSIRAGNGIVVVGAYGRTRGPNFDAGGAYIFQQPTGGWKDMAGNVVLTSSGARRSTGFGSSVGLSGPVIVVGAPFVYNDGVAYVFERP